VTHRDRDDGLRPGQRRIWRASERENALKEKNSLHGAYLVEFGLRVGGTKGGSHYPSFIRIAVERLPTGTVPKRANDLLGHAMEAICEAAHKALEKNLDIRRSLRRPVSA
jgi:hypothetical protein